MLRVAAATAGRVMTEIALDLLPDAVLVLDDGKPSGVLTRQDLLGFLAL